MNALMHSLILKYSNLTNVPEDIIEYMYKNKSGESKNMLKKLKSKYGEKDGSKYNKIFKPFYKALVKV